MLYEQKSLTNITRGEKKMSNYPFEFILFFQTQNVSQELDFLSLVQDDL